MLRHICIQQSRFVYHALHHLDENYSFLGVALDRNKNGQYFTPISIANEMVRFALELIPQSHEIKFLEPGFGYGVFYNALLQSGLGSRLVQALGYEINADYVEHVKAAKADSILNLKLEDFTAACLPPPEKMSTLLLCNPPYVRHHHISPNDKKRLSTNVKEFTGISLNGRAGLYCYFILLAHGWLAPNAISGWLLPSEFMDTDYGLTIREYLTNKVTLVRIHNFEPSESLFKDAEVSSTIVFFINKTPIADQDVSLSFGGSFTAPTLTSFSKLSQLRKARKWSKLLSETNRTKAVIPGSKCQARAILSDFFEVKRGIATGANDFFIISAKKSEILQLPREFLKPILPSSRYLARDEIEADKNGEPLFKDKLYLIDCSLSEEKLRQDYPRLWEYYELGMKTKIHLRTLCRSRKPWYSQELRPPTSIICKYMGNRSRPGNSPIKFILNNSLATATNAYHLLYPLSSLQVLLNFDTNLIRAIWQIFNEIIVDQFLVEGRTYGGGKFKIEPGELGKIPVGNIKELVNREGH